MKTSDAGSQAEARAAEPAAAGPERAWATDWRIAAIHLFVLWGLVAVQPILDVIPYRAEFLISREVGGLSFVLFIVAFALVPPLLLMAIELLAGRIRPALRPAFHLAFIGTLAAMGALYALKERFPNRSELVLVGAVVGGALFSLLYWRVRFVRALTTALVPAPIIFVALFLLGSSASDVVLPDGAEAADVRARSPVVILILDELPVTSLMNRSGRIDAERYPGFAELAGDATWFRNTTAAADFTTRAIPALLDGRRPRDNTTPTARDHPRNLFTLFARSHRLNALEHVTWVCPVSLCPGTKSRFERLAALPSAFSVSWLKIVLPARFTEDLPPLRTTWGEDERLSDLRNPVDVDGASKVEFQKRPGMHFQHFLDSIQPVKGGDRPPLHFLHVAVPHSPWKYLPSGRSYLADSSDRTKAVDTRDRWVGDPARVNAIFQRHLVQTQYSDRLVQRLLRRLRQQGLYDRSLVVVVADHGNSFRPGEAQRAIRRSNAADVGSVPLFMKAPGQRRGTVVDKFIQNIDVLPTMADLLHVRMPWHIEGRSAFDLPRKGRTRLVINGDKAGVKVQIDPATMLRLRRRTLARQLRLFGSGDNLFDFGTQPELHGRAVASLARAASGGASAQIDRAGDYGNVDLDSQFIPALVIGNISGRTAGVRDLAVAVNGRVASTTRAYDSGGQLKFAAMIPPRSLRSGRNRVEILAISGGGTATRLRPLGGTG